MGGCGRWVPLGVGALRSALDPTASGTATFTASWPLPAIPRPPEDERPAGLCDPPSAPWRVRNRLIRLVRQNHQVTRQRQQSHSDRDAQHQVRHGSFVAHRSLLIRLGVRLDQSLSLSQYKNTFL